MTCLITVHVVGALPADHSQLAQWRPASFTIVVHAMVRAFELQDHRLAGVRPAGPQGKESGLCSGGAVPNLQWSVIA